MIDYEVKKLIQAEEQRQRQGLELIPSENYVSRQILDAMGSVFTNKYSEGFPGRRYYGGQENTDKIETLAIERVKTLFGADHANVQPLSGAQANEAAFHSWLEPGDTILAMELSHGGHLTHGRPGTVLAKLFNYVRYGMKDSETGEIDYNHLRELAKKHRPRMILAGFSSYPRELDYAKFNDIAQEVGAVLVMDMAHIAGLIAGKALRNPFDYGFHMVTSTTHKTLRGPRGGLILTRGTAGNPLRAPEKTIDNLPTLVDRTVFPGVQGGPHMHVIAAKAAAFYEASQPSFQTYARQILANAQALAAALMSRGFKLVTNGTDNHMMVANVYASFGIHGGEAEAALDAVGLNLNKNVVPDDPLPPFRPSGIRLGTPAITTRGLTEKHMEQIATWMLQAIQARADVGKLSKIKQEVQAFSQAFPLPSDRTVMDRPRFVTRQAVFVILRNAKGELLLQQRHNTGYLDGYWDFSASGHVERGESIYEAASRELQEEIGVAARKQDLKLIHIDQYNMRQDYINWTFVLDAWQGQPKINEPEKVRALRYFAPNELPKRCVNNVRAVFSQDFSDELTFTVTNPETWPKLMGQPL